MAEPPYRWDREEVVGFVLAGVVLALCTAILVFG